MGTSQRPRDRTPQKGHTRIDLERLADDVRRRLGLQLGACPPAKALVGLDALCSGIDRPHRRLDELHARPDEVTVGMPDRQWQGAPEKDVQLGEPEDEAVTLVDQHDVEVVTDLF